MQAEVSSLQVIINPPGVQFGMPGDMIELYVIVINQGYQDALVNLNFSFDEEFKKVSGWSIPPQESLGIASQQTSDEVKFQFHIPVDAKPGTYDYTLVVDAPEHYPQEPPIYCSLQLKVQIKEQTVIRINDPTFSLQPSSNTNKPLILNPTQPLPVQVIVENRSNLVDRFYITCPDLDEEWFTITYPTTGFEGTGLSAVNALQLNPGSQGQILLTFHPPADTLAGIYSPNIRLHSENFPKLVLLDLVYMEIQPIYHLDVQLQTILAQVSRSPAKYELSLINQGNVVREFTFKLENRDEEALYTYKFQPSEIRLLPSKSSTTNLTVKPRPWWRRPWLGGGLVINFKPNIQDQQNFPIPNTLHQLSFVWKPRPWWQFLLLFLVCLGLLGGIGFIVWRLLNPDPLILEEFVTIDNKTQYIEGEEVALTWRIKNYDNLKKLVLTIKGTQIDNQPYEYDFSKGIPPELSQNCLKIKEELTCSNVKTPATTKGKYSFELQAFYRKGVLFSSREAKTDPLRKEVEISQKPIAEVVYLKTDNSRYTKGDPINLSWRIKRHLLLDRIQITGKAEDGTLAGKQVVYPFQDGKITVPQLQNRCQETVNQELECQNIPITNEFKAGKVTFEITAFSKNESERNSSKPTESPIEISPKPFKIVYFQIDNSEERIRDLQEGETATLSWKVEGEDIQVSINLFGNVSPSGKVQLPVNEALKQQGRITLEVSDKLGKRPREERTFTIAVKPKVQPTLDPPVQLPVDPISSP